MACWYFGVTVGKFEIERAIGGDGQTEGYQLSIDGAMVDDSFRETFGEASRLAEEWSGITRAVGGTPSNPKDVIGSAKLPLHLWPPTATAMGCIGMLEGAGKYGRNNFRECGVRASIYIDACKRHLDAWFEGEECAPDSGVPHLANALSCLAIIVDARAAGKLNDDRNFKGGGYRELVEELTPHIKRLKELHKGKDPIHYTIGYEKDE